MRTITEHVVPGDQAAQLEIQVLDEPGQGQACHRYEVKGAAPPGYPESEFGYGAYHVILFQNGPIKEHGVNGITGEALLAIEIDRLRGFQSGPLACADNQEALEHCEAALHALQRRTRARIARGVEGTNQK